MSKPTGKKILLPLGSREVNATSGRLLRIAGTLAAEGHQVDILTCDTGICDLASDYFKGNEKIRPVLFQREERFWTMADRDSFAKIFIKLNHDLLVPGTDFKFWKQVGFDDFLWNVSPSVYPRIKERYDLVLFPIPSFVENPPNSEDVLYTHVVFHARQHEIPLIGLQVYPVYDVPPLFHYLLDHYVVGSADEADYFMEHGVAEERVQVLGSLYDNYCRSTMQDTYKDAMFEFDFRVKSDELGIVLVNHARNRYQLYEILETVGSLDIPVKLLFVMLDFAVKEVHEKDVFEDLVKPVMERTVKNYALLKVDAIAKAIMLCDVVAASSYVLPLSFGVKYDKAGIVYNPLVTEVKQIQGVQFTASQTDLREALLSEYEKKKSAPGIADVITRVMV